MAIEARVIIIKNRCIQRHALLVIWKQPISEHLPVQAIISRTNFIRQVTKGARYTCMEVGTRVQFHVAQHVIAAAHSQGSVAIR